MNIYDRFQKGEGNRTYLRIDSKYQTDIFLGYNDSGNMSMVISEFGKETKVESSKLIEVTQKKRKDGKIALAFNLLDKSYESMYLVMCKDIILACENVKRDKAISEALLRWKHWLEMLKKDRCGMLSKEEIKGLIGELYVIKNYMISKYREENTIGGWRGPLLGHKDFEVEDTWYEVKAIASSAITVTINSLEQLDSDRSGHLMVIKLDETSSSCVDAISLNKMVLDVVDTIEDPLVMDLFKTRLSEAGYSYMKEYDDIVYSYKGMTLYKIDQLFPCLRRTNVSRAVGNVKYTLVINALKVHEECVE